MEQTASTQAPVQPLEGGAEAAADHPSREEDDAKEEVAVAEAACEKSPATDETGAIQGCDADCSGSLESLALAHSAAQALKLLACLQDKARPVQRATLENFVRTKVLQRRQFAQAFVLDPEEVLWLLLQRGMLRIGKHEESIDPKHPAADLEASRLDAEVRARLARLPSNIRFPMLAEAAKQGDEFSTFVRRKLQEVQEALVIDVGVCCGMSEKSVELPFVGLQGSNEPLNCQDPSWRDRFNVTVQGKHMTVKRVDMDSGWDQPLQIQCTWGETGLEAHLQRILAKVPRQRRVDSLVAHPGADEVIVRSASLRQVLPLWRKAVFGEKPGAEGLVIVSESTSLYEVARFVLGHCFVRVPLSASSVVDTLVARGWVSLAGDASGHVRYSLPLSSEEAADALVTHADLFRAPVLPPHQKSERAENIPVLDKHMGIIIGPRGATVKMLKELTGIQRVQVNGNTIKIRGNAEARRAAKRCIFDLCELGYMRYQFPTYTEARMRVPLHAIKDIIGRGGVIIRRLQEHFMARIRINSGPDRCKWSLVVIGGNREPVENCQKAIEELLMYHHHEVTHPGVTHMHFEVAKELRDFFVANQAAEVRHIQNNWHVQLHLPPNRAYTKGKGSQDQLAVVVGEFRNVDAATNYMQKCMEFAQLRKAEMREDELWKPVEDLDYFETKGQKTADSKHAQDGMESRMWQRRKARNTAHAKDVDPAFTRPTKGWKAAEAQQHRVAHKQQDLRQHHQRDLKDAARGTFQ